MYRPGDYSKTWRFGQQTKSITYIDNPAWATDKTQPQYLEEESVSYTGTYSLYMPSEPT
jgi:hypothetical protein